MFKVLHLQTQSKQQTAVLRKAIGEPYTILSQ